MDVLLDVDLEPLLRKGRELDLTIHVLSIDELELDVQLRMERAEIETTAMSNDGPISHDAVEVLTHTVDGSSTVGEDEILLRHTEFRRRDFELDVLVVIVDDVAVDHGLAECSGECEAAETVIPLRLALWTELLELCVKSKRFVEVVEGILPDVPLGSPAVGVGWIDAATVCSNQDVGVWGEVDAVRHDCLI